MKRAALGFCCVIALALLVLWTPAARGYPLYDDGGIGCVQCHVGFSGGPPDAQLHKRHVTDLGITECNLYAICATRAGREARRSRHTGAGPAVA